MSDPNTPPPVEPTPAATPSTPPPAAPTYAAPAVAKNGLSTAAFVLGIISVVAAVLAFIPFAGPFFFGWVAGLTGLVALILGIVGMNKGKQTGIGASRGRTGLILGIIGLVLSIVAIIVGFIEIAALVAAVCNDPSSTVTCTTH
jgi:hypothetical protein